MKINFTSLVNRNTPRTAGVKSKPVKRIYHSKKEKEKEEKLKDATKELAKFF